MKMNRGFAPVLCLLVALLLVTAAVAQETQAGVQGTVKDPQGLVVSKATVEISGPALIGNKKFETDASGYYRFANLPPGEYTITVTAQGFRTTKLTGIKLSAGSLPSIDPKLEVGGVEQTVEVTSEAPVVDVTQTKVQTNVNSEVLDGIPKGRSFQSVIPFAPGARQEPLQSRREDSGRANGFQIDGASDSENVYMSEGLDTTNIQDGGIGRANVPMEFVQEVQIKSSSFEAEFGGALGGVINVIQKRGGPAWHGSIFSYYRGNSLDANDQCITRGFVNTTCGLRLQPGTGLNSGTAGKIADGANATLWKDRQDGVPEYYIQKEDRWRVLEPGFEIGGPLLKDRLWLFTSYVPSISNTVRTVNFSPIGSPNQGPWSFTRRDTTHNGMARADYRLTNSVRLFGAWQYAYLRTVGINMPGTPDSALGQVNGVAGNDPATAYRTDTGSTNPYNVLNFGGDWTVTPKLVVQARYGYFYQDSQDRGKPQGTRYIWQQDSRCNMAPPPVGDPASFYCTGNFNHVAGSGPAIPAANQQTVGFTNMSANQQSLFDIYSRKAFTTDASYYVGNFFGTHNFKGGYSVQRLANSVQQAFVTSQVQIFYGTDYTPAGNPAVCAAIVAANGACRGSHGYYLLRDGVNVNGDVSALNHALYFQDAWTFKGFTVNAGVRFDKEFLPPYSPVGSSIGFGFGDKVAPRIGVAYDVLHNGKVKAYFSYGKFFDIMKYSLPRGSFGGDYWHDCVYTLNTFNYTTIVPANVGGRFCPPSGGATGALDGTLIENVDWRASTDQIAGDPVVDPNIKPMQQHEYVAGVDWAITPTISFESRYSRKRLDETIEDIAVSDTSSLFYIGNPGSTFSQLLHRPLASSGLPAVCPTCPLQPKAVRDYDGLEFRLTKRPSDKWFGAISYTYSKLNGNYPGLASSFVSDGNGGRHSPNNNRSFDAPQMQFDAHGNYLDGPLPTDRPHTLKMFGFYRLKWFHQESLFGLTQSIFSGTPLSTCIPTGASASSCQFVEGQGNWLNFHQDATTHNMVLDSITRGRRTSAFTQTDLNISHEVKVSKTNENLRIGFTGNISNLFNQRAVLSLFNSPLGGGVISPSAPITAANPTGFDYNALLSGWDYMAIANDRTVVPCSDAINYCYAGPNTNLKPNTLASRYNVPNLFQGSRSIRLQVKFMF